MFSAKNMFTNPYGKIFSDRDDHPNDLEGFTIDPSPLPEETVTVKHTNLKNLYNRSYIETVSIGAGSIVVLAMIIKHSRN